MFCNVFFDNTLFLNSEKLKDLIICNVVDEEWAVLDNSQIV